MPRKRENRLVVADAGWAADIPEWLLREIERERMVSGMASLVKELDYRQKVGDAEVCAYLMTASLRQPMPHEYAEIYVCLGAKLTVECRGTKTEDLPPEIRAKYETGLSNYEQRTLDEIKYEIYQARGGDIRSPLFDALKELKKRAAREDAKRMENKNADGQDLLW